MVDHDPYSTPRSPLSNPDQSPFRFQQGQHYDLDVSELRLAGWLAFLSALLTIPYYLLWFEVASEDAHPLEELATLVGLCLTAAALFVLDRFRRLLNQKSRFSSANVAIQWLIFLAIGMGVLSVVSVMLPEAPALTVMSIIISVIYGVTLIRLGRALRDCRDSLYGRLPMMIQLTVASGVLIATVVLAFLSALTSVVVDILFALVFFDAARELREVSGAKRDVNIR